MPGKCLGNQQRNELMSYRILECGRQPLKGVGVKLLGLIGRGRAPLNLVSYSNKKYMNY